MSSAINYLRYLYATDMPGDCLTRPLKIYKRWFAEQIENTIEGTCKHIAYRVAHVVTAIFAYPILGCVALIGMGIKFGWMPPEETGWSLFARLSLFSCRTNQLLNALEKDCKELSESAATYCYGSQTQEQVLIFEVNCAYENIDTVFQALKLNVIRTCQAQNMQATDYQVSREISGTCSFKVFGKKASFLA